MEIMYLTSYSIYQLLRTSIVFHQPWISDCILEDAFTSNWFQFVEQVSHLMPQGVNCLFSSHIQECIQLINIRWPIKQALPLI